MPQFAATTKAFEKGVGSMSAEASIKLIESWEGQLEGAEFKEAKAIHRDLEALKKELAKGEKMNGEKVRELTAKLGAETIKSAANVEGSGGDKIKAIGEALSQVG